MPRIIAGSAGGQRLRVPTSARPTADRVKEAIFSSLGPLKGAIVLDLYGGSGGLALEALSRGATGAVCYEPDPGAVKIITANAAQTGLADRLTVIAKGCDRAPRTHPAGPFTHIFADPPYDFAVAQLTKALHGFIGLDAISPDAVLILERDKRRPGEMPEGWTLLRERFYGEAVIRYGERDLSDVEDSSGGR